MENRSRWLDAGQLTLLSLLFVPLTTLVHEVCHFLVSVLSQLPAQLHPTAVTGGAQLGREAPWLVALQAGVGPLATVFMTAVGLFFVRRDTQPLWALALAGAAVARFIMAAAWLGISLSLLAFGRSIAGRPNFDEYVVAEALAIAPELIAVPATIFFVGTIIWLVCSVPRGRRIIYSVVVCTSVSVSTVLWSMLRPIVLATT